MCDEVRDHKAFCCQYHPSVIKLLVEISFYIQRILDTSYLVLKVRTCGSDHNRPYCNQHRDKSRLSSDSCVSIRPITHIKATDSSSPFSVTFLSMSPLPSSKFKSLRSHINTKKHMVILNNLPRCFNPLNAELNPICHLLAL